MLDIRSAYDVKALKRLERTFVFSREGSGSLTVTDEVELASPQSFETALVTFEQSKPGPEGVLLVGQGAEAVKVAIAVTGTRLFRLASESIREDLPGGRIPTRWAVELAEPVTSATIRMTITPAARKA